MNLVALFITGMFEYILAATWTKSLIEGRVFKTSAISFISVVLWGYVVNQIAVGNFTAIIIHGAGCALGAGLVCWRSNPMTESEDPDTELSKA